MTDILELIRNHPAPKDGNGTGLLLTQAADEIKRLRTEELRSTVGWRLAPIEPTPDMRIAGGIAWSDALSTAETYVDTADACYKAMLSAAPFQKGTGIMTTKNIMYVCSKCADDSPETCGHFDRSELRVLPDGRWLCEPCYDARDRNEMTVVWANFYPPPEYVPAPPVIAEKRTP